VMNHIQLLEMREVMNHQEAQVHGALV